MADMRRCIGSAKYGIEAHEALLGDFPTQPSQKDGLGRMCKPHWNQYTAGLARDRKARLAADGAAEMPPVVERLTRAAKEAGAKVTVKRVPSGETPAVTVRRQTFEARLAKVGVSSDAGQKLLAKAAAAARGPKTVDAADGREAANAEEASIA